MKKTADASRIVHAWLHAWNLRCCPPDTVLAGGTGPELEEHLQICPLCRQARADGLPPVDIGLQARDIGRTQGPAPGELWSLSGAMAGWGPKCRYYTPPVVLVTDLAADGAVNVVQIFGDPVLAGPGDVLLDGGIIGFAEPWNRYTLREEDLELFLGAVTRECLHRVTDCPDTPAASPEPGSLLWFFRQMEVETGWFFASQAIDSLLGREISGMHSSLARDSLAVDLGGLPLVLPASVDDDTIPTFLARTMPADDLLPHAAAGPEPDAVQILIFSVTEGRIRQVQVEQATLSLQVEEEGVLRVSGHCDSLQDVTGEWIFRWQSAEWSIEPLAGQHGVKEGVFWAAFSVDGLGDPDRGELVIRVLVAEK